MAEIVAICDKDESRSESLANHIIYNEFEKVIAESGCDLVDICLPNFLHHDVALEAFNVLPAVCVTIDVPTKI